MSLSPGTRLGSYEVTALIGQGGMPRPVVLASTGLRGIRPTGLPTFPSTTRAVHERLDQRCTSVGTVSPNRHCHGYMTGLWAREGASRSLLAFLILMVLVTLTACGSGNLVTESREVGSFTRIDVSGGANVELTVDPSLSQSVSVTYDDNLLDNIVTRVDDNTLIIETKGLVPTPGASRRFVTVVTDDIEEIAASGGADVTGEGVTESYTLRASGGSDVDLLDLQASSVEIDASGGTDVWVFASQSVTGEASGGADVEIFGSPPNVNVSESGGADVNVGD